jgi:hypothetical protein
MKHLIFKFASTHDTVFSTSHNRGNLNAGAGKKGWKNLRKGIIGEGNRLMHSNAKKLTNTLNG